MISDSFTKESIQLSDSIRSDFQLNSQENAVFNQIDWTKCPRHIAIIMDGNGRWAKQRGKLRTTGHKAGVQSVYEVVETCGKLPTEYVTFYAFSTENWRRSESEVNALMGLFSSSLIKYIDRLEKDGVNLRVIGDLSRMGSKIQEEFKQAQSRTLDNSKIDYLIDLIKKSDKCKKKIVFCSFIKEGEKIQQILSDNHYVVGIVNGSTPKKMRRIFLTSNNIDVLIIQIQCGSDGLNLQHYQEIYFTSPHWNPAVVQQAIGRIYRIGQKADSVNVHSLVSHFDIDSGETMDEYCLRVQKRKEKIEH